MNNEPVAWMDYLEHSDVFDLNVSGRGIPLYTHPAKTQADIEYEADKAYWRTRTLTDEEIWDVWADFTNCDGEFTEPEAELLFARAILRKAQEK